MDLLDRGLRNELLRAAGDAQYETLQEYGTGSGEPVGLTASDAKTLIVNGEAREIEAENLARGADRARLRRRDVATALNGTSCKGEARRAALRQAIGRDRRAEAGGLRCISTASRSRPASCSAPRNIPRPRSWPTPCARSGRRHRHRLAAPRSGAAAASGQDFWRLIRELGVRVLPNTAGCHTREGGGHDGARWRASFSARPGSSSR